MQLAQLVARDAPQPEEERHRGLAHVGSQILPGFQVGILQDVRGINTPLEPLIETKGHHSVQTLTTLAQESVPGTRIALGGLLQELIGFVRFAWHRRNHVFLLRPRPNARSTGKPEVFLVLTPKAFGLSTARRDLAGSVVF